MSASSPHKRSTDMPIEKMPPDILLLAARETAEALRGGSCGYATQVIERLLEQHEVQARALRAIHFNADSWHGDDQAKGRALNVIAAWALHPESVPVGVGE